MLNWRVALYGALAALVVFAPLIANLNGNDVLYLFVVAPALVLGAICLLVYAAIRHKPRIAFTVVVFGVISVFLYSSIVPLHIFTKWALWSGEYKKEVLAQPTAKDGGFKHIEWDGWGWAGQDTSVFLVYDPSDSLSLAARNRESGRVKGIPCEVSLVERMDRQWYIIFFESYIAQSSWDRCKSN